MVTGAIAYAGGITTFDRLALIYGSGVVPFRVLPCIGFLGIATAVYDFSFRWCGYGGCFRWWVFDD